MTVTVTHNDPYIDVTRGPYNARGDGITDDTDALADAFAAAGYTQVVFFPPGTYLTDTIQYRGESVQGAGPGLTTIKGKPSQDVFHLDPTVTQFATENMTLSGFTVLVNDSVNAAASFPQRGGAGNAGFAVDFANGAGAIPLMMLNSKWADIEFRGSSGTAGGANTSAGIYTQFQTINVAQVERLRFTRLTYGWWDHYPTSNLTSSEHARDHLDIASIFFQYCGNPWRIVNASDWSVSGVTMHAASGNGLTVVGIASLVRAKSEVLTFQNVMIEDVDLAAIAFAGTNERLRFDTLKTHGMDTAITWSADDCRVTNWSLHVTGNPSPCLTVTGDRNEIAFIASGAPSTPFGRSLVTDTGSGNAIVQLKNESAVNKSRTPWMVGGVAPRHVPDSTALGLGHVNPMFTSGADLLINPNQIVGDGIGGVEGVDYSYVADSTADFGVVFRKINAAGHLYCNQHGVNGYNGFVVGAHLPPGKVRLYLKAKAAAAGNSQWDIVTAAYGAVSSATFALTTSYAVYASDVDLSALASDTYLQLVIHPVAGGMAPMDVAWVGFRPWAKDVVIDSAAWNGGHLVMGAYHLWVDATGDLRIKSGAPASDLDGVVTGTQT